jgi:tetratricopeptide (TPR) repeat protein
MPALNRQQTSADVNLNPAMAPLQHLCDSILNCTMAYSDIAVFIENRAYEEWQNGRVGHAIDQLIRITTFLERPRNSSDQTKRELADVYFLIGQLCQYSGLYSESIEWLSKSVFIDDGKSLSYHSIAESYVKTGNINQAARSYERELALDEGNYFTYLELAAIYERDGKPEKAEECLRKLLARDPDNIQGIHQLIQYYEKNNPSIDVKLLTKRLLNIEKKFSGIEAVIRSFYLLKVDRNDNAVAFISSWERDNNDSPVVACAKAYCYGRMKNVRLRKKETARFKAICKDRQDVIAGHIEEFRNVFGDVAAEKLLSFCFPQDHVSGTIRKV